MDRQRRREGHGQPKRLGQAPLRGAEVQDVVKEGRVKLKTVKGTERSGRSSRSSPTGTDARFPSKRECSSATCISFGRPWGVKDGRDLSVSAIAPPLGIVQR